MGLVNSAIKLETARFPPSLPPRPRSVVSANVSTDIAQLGGVNGIEVRCRQVEKGETKELAIMMTLAW